MLRRASSSLVARTNQPTKISLVGWFFYKQKPRDNRVAFVIQKTAFQRFFVLVLHLCGIFWCWRTVLSPLFRLRSLDKRVRIPTMCKMSPEGGAADLPVGHKGGKLVIKGGRVVRVNEMNELVKDDEL